MVLQDPVSEVAPDRLRITVQAGARLDGRKKEPGSVTLFVVGDTVLPEVEARRLRAHPWESMIGIIRQYTWSVADVEGPVTTVNAPIVKSGPHLRSAPILAEVLKQGGFNVASLANNHILDMGPSGLSDTLQNCGDGGLLVVGAGADLGEACRPLVVEASGFSVAILALAEREFSIATRESPGAAPLRIAETVHEMRALSAQVDAVVVLLHSGVEHYALPSPGMVHRCHLLVDAGATAVVCHHSHVPSGAEVYRGAPIVYGLGNFFFPLPKPPTSSWCRGQAVSLRLGRSGVEECVLAPHEQRTDGGGVTFLSEDGEVDWFAARFAALSRIIADDRQLSRRWQEHCRRAAPYYLGGVLGLTRIERRMLRIGVWPSWRVRRRLVPEIADLVRCESHLEVLDTILEDEMGRGEG